MTGATTLLGAVGIGLLGSAHCVAMCGGVVGAVALGLPPGATRAARLRLAVVVSLGRILGYGAGGMVAGALGLGVAGALGPQGAAALRVLAAVVLLGVAAVLAGISPAARLLERAGARVWQRLAPLARHLRGAPGDVRGLLLGVLWGWVPCGLVYGALGWAATTGHPLTGGSIMVAFGIGTLPAMVAAGTAAARISELVRRPGSRRTAAVLLAVFAVWTLAGAGSAWQGEATGAACHDPASGPAAP